MRFLRQNKIRIFLCLALSFLMLLAEGAVPAFAAASVSAKKTAGMVVESGVYRIRNLETGLYIDSYDFIYDAAGNTYLESKNSSEAQDIYVCRQSDGTYTLMPQSENGKYSLSCKSGYAEESIISKKEDVGKTEKFVIYPAASGTYTISPAYSGKIQVALDVSDELSKYDDPYVCLKAYSGSRSQRWVLVPVKTDGISLAYESTTVKLYSVGTLYVTLYPYNYGTHNVTWKSDNEKVLMIDSSGSYCALAPGSATVTASCAGYTASCTVNVTETSAFTWYSQHNASGSDWSAEGLSGIYFTSGGVRKRFMVDKYGKGADWMDEGCYLASVAMVLRNMGAQMTVGYDIRSGQSGNLPADPYTVALANSGNTGATTQNAVMSGNPILVSLNNIASRFRVGNSEITASVSYDTSKKAIKEALDEHPEGVIVYFSMPQRNRSHYIVFTKCLNPEAKNPSDYVFEVCDSASYTAEGGDHVTFENCISYTSEHYRYSNAVSILTWNIKDSD